MRSPITIRPSLPGDREFVLAVAARLAAFPLPSWRTSEEVVGGERRTLEGYFASPSGEAALLIAEAAGTPLGFVFLETVHDYFDGERHGHVGILAVAAESEGVGAGRALMAAAERWARERGFARLTLNVFERNRRARALYERLGYEPETLRYVKQLG